MEIFLNIRLYLTSMNHELKEKLNEFLSGIDFDDFDSMEEPNNDGLEYYVDGKKKKLLIAS